jgi:Phosphopantetheine attachment site.
MVAEQFVKDFVSVFDNADLSDFTADTRFKEHEEWSSLVALSVIIMIDERYHVRIKADDIRNSQTINDLYNRVIQELSNNDATAINECKVISAEKPEVVTKKI